MSFDIPIEETRHQITTIQGTNKLIVVYTLLSTVGEILINRKPLVIELDIIEGSSIPTNQEIADMISTDCKQRFGGQPNSISVGKITFTPSKEA